MKYPLSRLLLKPVKPSLYSFSWYGRRYASLVRVALRLTIYSKLESYFRWGFQTHEANSRCDPDECRVDCSTNVIGPAAEGAFQQSFQQFEICCFLMLWSRLACDLPPKHLLKLISFLTDTLKFFFPQVKFQIS